MIYYLGKLFQAAGLAIVIIDFFRHFPKLMSHNTLLTGMGVFFIGWIIEQYLVKRK